MKNYPTVVPARLLKFLLLTFSAMTTLSSLTLAAPLMIGDEYGGGRVVYIYQPGDKRFAETADQAVIVAKADVSASSSWSDTRSSTDKLEGIGSHDGNLHERARQARNVQVKPDFQSIR